MHHSSLASHLKLQLLWGLPCESLSSKVSICSSWAVNWGSQVQLLDDVVWSEVKVLVDNLQNLRIGLGSGAVGINVNGKRFCNTDSISQLNQASLSESSSNNGFCNPSCSVASGSVNLGWVLSGESSTSVSSPSTVCINNNFTSGQTSISVWSSDYESARWVQVIDCVLVNHIRWNNWADNVLFEESANLVVGDVLIVLSGDQNSVYAFWSQFVSNLLVLKGNLGLSIRTELSASSCHVLLSCLGELKSQLGSKVMREWHKLLRLGGCITKHESLISSTQLFVLLSNVYSLSDIWGLLLNTNQNVAGLVVKSLVTRIETNLLYGLTYNSLVVNNCLGGDLSENHNHTSFATGLASYLGHWVLSEALIEDCIRYKIAKFIRVSLSNGLRGE
mmetsp:Transcript_11622/g.43658  ORF Transcript_11622/g.43658 Transcript_11622/m.43658 type:complete len:390 (+) Transcript_11622:242-1411(+)